MTQGKGSNLDPTWSPDGRLLAYVSSRGGLFVHNPETHHEVQIWRGSARPLLGAGAPHGRCPPGRHVWIWFAALRVAWA